MAYNSLADFPALQQRSNANYDDAEDQLRKRAFSPRGFIDPFNTMEQINVGQAKVAPTAPWFQALREAKVGRAGQDTARPEGLGDEPTGGDVGAHEQAPLMGRQFDSTNIATPNPSPVVRRTAAVRGLLRANGRPGQQLANPSTADEGM